MKYIVLIGDGMTDYPLKQLGNKTPLQVAHTPNMDFLAQNGVCGWVNNVPAGLQPASDVANMSIFGYDPKEYYSGRGPLEAASLGVKLKPNDIAFRCNLVTIKDDKMQDFTAGHISTPEATKIMKMLEVKLGDDQVKFYPGLSYRHLLIMSKRKGQNSKLMNNIKTTPPHDITGQKIGKYLPKGPGSAILLQLMNESKVLLHGMKTKATIIWPWSPGRSPKMPGFKNKFHKKAAIITAVHLLKGLGKILGMQVINVPGATGYLDTNYIGKANAAIKALKTNDVVFVHVEAPDEAGHEGSIEKKIKAIEDFDKKVVGVVIAGVKGQGSGVKILVLPDHPTPIKMMTHTRDDVPFVIWEEERRQKRAEEGIEGYNEKDMKKAKLRIRNGHELLGLLFS